MNFNSVVIIGKLLTVAQPFVNDEQLPGLRLEVEVIDRYYNEITQRKKHLTQVTILIYKKTIRDFILKLEVGDEVLFSCKLGNICTKNLPAEAEVGLIISPYLGEAILLDKAR